MSDPSKLLAVVETLTAQPEVKYVGRTATFHSQNQLATTLMQSNTLGPHPIWKRNLTGMGQLAHVGDTGLDYDSCFFRDETERYALLLYLCACAYARVFLWYLDHGLVSVYPNACLYFCLCLCLCMYVWFCRCLDICLLHRVHAVKPCEPCEETPFTLCRVHRVLRSHYWCTGVHRAVDTAGLCKVYRATLRACLVGMDTRWPTGGDRFPSASWVRGLRVHPLRAWGYIHPQKTRVISAPGGSSVTGCGAVGHWPHTASRALGLTQEEEIMGTEVLP